MDFIVNNVKSGLEARTKMVVSKAIANLENWILVVSKPEESLEWTQRPVSLVWSAKVFRG